MIIIIIIINDDESNGWVPWESAVFYSFLAVFSPSVSVFQVIYLAFCHESKSGFFLSLLTCFLGFQAAVHKKQK